MDLEDSFLVHQVVILNRSDHTERLKHFNVIGSPFGREWQELFRKTDDHVFGSDGEPSLPRSRVRPWRASCACGWTERLRRVSANARCSASIPTLRSAREWRGMIGMIGMIGARWPGRHPPALE